MLSLILELKNLRPRPGLPAPPGILGKTPGSFRAEMGIPFPSLPPASQPPPSVGWVSPTVHHASGM